MNPGDAVARVHARHRWPATGWTSPTSRPEASGSMTASIANGFGHVLFQPDAKKCHVKPYAFHPMYDSAVPRGTTWAAHTTNVGASDEIGHFEYCRRGTTPSTLDVHVSRRRRPPQARRGRPSTASTARTIQGRRDRSSDVSSTMAISTEPLTSSTGRGPARTRSMRSSACTRRRSASRSRRQAAGRSSTRGLRNRPSTHRARRGAGESSTRVRSLGGGAFASTRRPARSSIPSTPSGLETTGRYLVPAGWRHISRAQ